jgi:hypothetical protein
MKLIEKSIGKGRKKWERNGKWVGKKWERRGKVVKTLGRNGKREELIIKGAEAKAEKQNKWQKNGKRVSQKHEK